MFRLKSKNPSASYRRWGLKILLKRIIKPQPPRGTEAARSATVEGSSYSLQVIRYCVMGLGSTLF
jgi:hypothetical protein